MIHAQLKQRYGSVYSNTGSSYSRYKILLTAVFQTSIPTFLELKNRLNAYSFWMVAVDTSITVTWSLLKISGVLSCSFPQYAAIVAFIVVYFRIKDFPKIKQDITICCCCKLDKTLKLLNSINMWLSLCATETILFVFGTSNQAEINELRHWIL